MAVGNEWTISCFKRNIKSNSYLAHSGPYQFANKGKQVASSIRWGLGDNVALRFMECLTLTVGFNLITDNYFKSSRLFASLPTLELTTFKQEVCSTKLGYENTLLWGTNSCKKGTWPLWTAPHTSSKYAV